MGLNRAFKVFIVNTAFLNKPLAFNQGQSSSKLKEGQPEKRGAQRTIEKRRAEGAQKFSES